MPSNLYGVANAPALAVKVVPGNTTANGGVETVIITSPPMIAPSQGFFYPVCFWNAYIAYSATLPTNWSMNARIGAGADFDSYNINLGGVAASTFGYEFTTLIGPASSIPWLGAGSLINMTATLVGAGSSITFSGIGSQCWFLLLRAPDQ